MTTVAYRAGVLAADTQMTDGSIKVPGRKLIYVKERLAWVGIAGSVCDCQKFIRHFAGTAEEEFDDDDDLTALIMFHDGKVVVVTADLREDELEPNSHFAIGSGGPAALAAMHMGADARRAIEVAAAVDLLTGGDVMFAKRGSRRATRQKMRPQKAAHRRG
jgi:ATP-dependent protease HslVU (ClpYQ) peptidase subunit